MTAATQDLGSSQRIGSFYELPPKAGTTHYIGTLAGDKAGEAVPVTADVLIKRIGVVEAVRGPQGAPFLVKVSVDSTKEYGPFQNSTAGDALTDADSGVDVYGVDNQTLAKTSATNTRPWVGYLSRVTAEGVFFRKAKI
jgi:hypothetical protein